MPGKKVFSYNVEVNWLSEKKGEITSDNKQTVMVATPPEFGGHEGVWTPEDLLVASVTSCMMTTFLYYSNKENLELVKYSSGGKGFLEFGKNGLEFTRIEIYVEVKIKKEEQYELCEKLILMAKKTCLISRAMKPEVVLEYNIGMK